MTPVPRSLTQVLEGVRRALRRETALAVAFSALCAVPAALLIAWLLGLVRPWRYPGFGPLALDALVIGGAAALTYFGMRRWLGGLDENAVAADAERSAGMAQGSVRGALELSRTVPHGTSAALARRAEEEMGRRFAGVAPESIAVTLRERVRRRRRAAAGTLVTLSLTAVLLAFAAPEHSRAAWAPMANPVRNLKPPVLPALDVQPGNVEVQRGGDVSVRVRAVGRTAVTVRWRMEGDVPHSELAPVMADSARVVIPRIDSDAEYWVEAPDGATSARYTITPTDPLLLADLAIDVVYPPHVGRATDHYQGEVPSLEIPEGTQLLIRGRATRALADAGLRDMDGAAVPGFAVSGERFTGSFTPRASGMYTWQLRDASGGDVEFAPVPLQITVVADAAPHVDITFPVRDTVLDASLRQAVVADARDDFGLAEAALVSWRVSGAGEVDTQVVEPIRMTGDDRALIRGLLDASTRHLVPGDTLKFFIRVTDTSPRAQSAVSRTVALRLPGRVEMREQSVDRANELVSETEQLAQAAAELQRTTRDLERRTSAANARRAAERQQRQQRGGRNDAAGEQKMDYREASDARQMLERQDELVEQLEEMRSRLEALEHAMERSGLQDAELRKRLQELRELQESMLTPEMREQMEALRKALEELDPEALQQALEQMAQQQQELKEQLDESLEMMRRAAVEQQMNSLAQEARELATQQETLAQSMAEQQPTQAQAEAQQELSERARDLSRSLEEMQQQLQGQGEQQTAESTGQAQQNTESAGQQMRQAAADAAQKDGTQAAEKGNSAAAELEQAAETLDQAREALAEQWKQEAQQSLEQATRDALSLAERQQQLLERMKAAEQGQQGADQMPQPQPGQQQQGQQGGQQGQQQQGQQRGGQQGQQQGGQQGQQQGGQQQGGQQGQQQGGQMPGQQGGGGSGSMQSMQSEQGALQQGLQQLGRNLQENGERSGAMNQDVSASLGRANRSMQQTLDQMQGGQLPTDQAQQTVDALNRLALSLLNNSQSMGEQSGEGSQALQQMADIAKKQGDLNGRSNALTPMDVTQAARGQQLNRLAQEQMEIARRLGELNRGGAESMMGDIDALAQEAERIAREMQSGRMPPETVARQERLFHRMLDAGRSLEKDEVEDERSAERPGGFDARGVDALDPALFTDPNRFTAPGAAELQALPPAYRRLILDYFERLNRQDPRQQERSPAG